MKKTWPIVGIIIMLTCILFINLFSIPMHDELSYAFGGQSTPLVGSCSRVNSLIDIVYQQWADYHGNGNGRVIIHGMAAFFSGFRLYYLFDLLNTIVWAVFVYLLMREGRLSITASTYFACLCYAFIFLWYAESCSMNAVFAIDYLWCPALTIAMMRGWRRWSNRLWFVPLCFVFGWTQDASVLPFICSITGAFFANSCIQRHIDFNFNKVLNYIAIVVGCAFLCLSPASLSRAGETLNGSIGESLHAVIALVPGLILYGTPPLLIVLLVIVLLRNRKDFFSFVHSDIEWWLFFCSALGLYTLCAPIAGNRLMMPWLMAGTIIIFRHHKHLRCQRIVVPILCCLVMIWVIAVSFLQVKVGEDNQRMLATYQENESGITWRSPLIAPGYSISRGIFNQWHLSLFAREYNKSMPPVFFSKWMYDNIYINPNHFMLSAELLPGTKSVMINRECGYCALKKGENRFSSHEKHTADTYFHKQIGVQNSYLPGRLSRMFPRECDLMDPRINEFTFIAKDGNPYVVYCGGKYNPKRIDSVK